MTLVPGDNILTNGRRAVMGTISDVLHIAESQIGTKESPPNSNRVKYNTWYYGEEVSGINYAWCMVFCQWVYATADVKLPKRTASCTTMMNAAIQRGQFAKGNYAPGDLLLYDFNGSGYPQHCGVLYNAFGGTYKAIEGNTSYGNNTNGGEVMLRTRYFSSIVGAVRPIFSEEEGIDMTRREFLDSLTDEESYILLTKAIRYSDKLPQPEWSKKEGYWDKAIEKKIITSDTPESPLKRDEMIAILGRIGIV